MSKGAGCLRWIGSGLLLAIAVVIGMARSGKFDILNALDSNHEHSANELAFYTTMFCLSPMPSFLMNDRAVRPAVIPLGNESLTFEETGNIEDDDYAQSSIYSALYALYKNSELTSEFGVKYQFTFNTWAFLAKTVEEKVRQGGVLGDLSNRGDKADALAHYDFQVRFPERDPERFGKHAYASLATQKAALEYMRQNNVGLGDGTYFDRNTGKEGPAPVEIVEIGCGTGAGANLITRHIVKNSNYLALDMQKAAVNTCQARHEGRGYEYITELTAEEKKVDSQGLHPSEALIGTPVLEKLHRKFPDDNPSLRCRLVPNGVGHKWNATATELNGVPRETSSVDMVIISETHIADMKIGDLEENIFKEIRRVLKPGGLFLWGNAIPTRVWKEAEEYLPQLGFELLDDTNHTSDAVLARDLDKARVDLLIPQLLEPFGVFKVPYVGPRCHYVIERLIANFYRHPGTALYLNMVTNFDSYMQQAWRLRKDAATVE